METTGTDGTGGGWFRGLLPLDGLAGCFSRCCGYLGSHVLGRALEQEDPEPEEGQVWEIQTYKEVALAWKAGKIWVYSSGEYTTEENATPVRRVF